MKERTIKYSRFSPDCEPRTPYGAMRQRQQAKKRRYMPMFTPVLDGFIETYNVNHEILTEIRELYDKHKYSSIYILFIKSHLTNLAFSIINYNIAKTATQLNA